jgi:hypothetical protein
MPDSGVGRTELVEQARIDFKGGELFTPFENWLRLICVPSSHWFGRTDQVEVRQRAFDQLLAGDPVLLREQTVEPLHVMAVLSEPGSLLPGSLRTRVHTVAVEAELGFDRWQGSARLITANHQDAVAVATVLGSWRDMALSVTDVYSENGAKQAVHRALDNSSITADGDTVTVRVTAPGNLAVRGICKLLRLSSEGAP